MAHPSGLHAASSSVSVPAPAWLGSPQTLRSLDVVTTLADFAIITYAVDPDRLQRLLPSDFTAHTVNIDGRPRALVSAVPFRDLDFRFGFAPWLRFHFGQTNYRAYVLYRGTPCVWFFGTSLATPWYVIPAYLWRLPWHHARMRFDATWEGDRCRQYRLATGGAWGRAVLDLEGSDEPMGILPGFSSEDETAQILTHPLVGYFHRRDGRVGSYSVWHDRLRLQRGRVTRARFQVFCDLGLVGESDAPHSALLQRATEFHVYLPPRVVRD